MSAAHAKTILAWVFDSKTQIISVQTDAKDCLEAQFSFKLTRNKDDASHQECLDVQCLFNGQDNGTVHTSISDIEKDLRQFLRYGVALSPVLYADLQQEIRNNYLKLGVIHTTAATANSVTPDVICEVLYAVAEMIVDAEIEEKNGFYNIESAYFDEIFSEGDLSVYPVSAVKEALAKSDIIKHQKGRYTTIIRIKSKVFRVMSFASDELKDCIEKIKAANK